MSSFRIYFLYCTAYRTKAYTVIWRDVHSPSHQLSVWCTCKRSRASSTYTRHTGIWIHCTRRGLFIRLNHCARTCYPGCIITRCRFTNWPIRCEWGAEPCIFLAAVWLAFAVHVVLFWSWLAWCGGWTAKYKEIYIRNIGDFSIKKLLSRGTKSCMFQQTWHASVCFDWERNIFAYRRD